jgi:RNA polymerase sigma-70 factor (ECF subfamily)
LIARLRNLEDAAAWREFEASYRPFIRKVGADAGVSRETLADLVQDVLLTIVRMIPRFAYDPDRGRFRSWLARIVRTRSSDLARKSRRELLLESRLRRRFFEGTFRPSGMDEGSIRTTALAAALRIVRTGSRDETWQCFQRHILGREPAADVAQSLGISVNAVYLNSMRTMRRVQAECLRVVDQGQRHESGGMSISH